MADEPTLTLTSIATAKPVLLSSETQTALTQALASCPAEALQATLAVTDTGTGKSVGVILAGRVHGRWDAAVYAGRPAHGKLEAGFTVVYHLGR